MLRAAEEPSPGPAPRGARVDVTQYNYQRFSLALKGHTPAEKLAATLPPQAA